MASATARIPDQPAKPDSELRNVTRREFLNYMLGASVGLLALEAAGAAVWFALPHPILGRDIFEIAPKDIPLPEAAPIPSVSAHYWICNTNQGLLVLSGICTRHGVFIRWINDYHRFVCPVCASEFQLDGTKVVGHGPAPRDLDRFILHVRTPSGERVTSTNGEPISIEDAVNIQFDVRWIILGKSIYGTPSQVVVNPYAKDAS